MFLNHDIYKPLYLNDDKFIVLVTGGRGCEHPDTPIMMADLTIKKIKYIKVGDKVMGDDGTPRNVLELRHGFGQMYKVHQTNAEDYIVNDSHILCVRKKPSCHKSYALNAHGLPKQPNGRYPDYPDFTDIGIQEFMGKSKRFRENFSGYKTHSIPYPEREVLIEPYMLGLWLGDGSKSCTQITNPDEEVREYVKGYCERYSQPYHEVWRQGAWHMKVSSDNRRGHNLMLNHLKAYDLIDNKHIPQEYISNSERVRLELLAGLVDTDGNYDTQGDYEIIQKSEALARQIKFIADTLGFKTHLKAKKANIGDKDYGAYWRINISGDINRIPCKIRRKQAGEHYRDRSWLVSKLTIEDNGYGEWYGFILDGNHRYLHADGTVTHNSGKSSAISTFIERLTFEIGEASGKKVSHQILYSRYTMVSAEISIIPEFMEKVEADGTARYFRATKKDVINLMTNSKVMFRGIRTSSGNQTAKLKSIKGLTVFVCDEGEEWVSEKEFETIMFSIRQLGLRNLIIIIMNPTDSNHFIYQKYIKDTHKLVDYDGVPVQISTHPNVLHIHTSYLDNKQYLSEQFLREAEEMKRTNPERYAHVFMGRWADVREGAVFKNWGIVDEFPAQCKHVARGLDFGYTHDPSACIKGGVWNNCLYLDEQFYETGMLSSDLIRELKKDKSMVYADSADPRLIDEIGNAGIVIYPVMKGAGSIVAGIDRIKTFDHVFVTKRSIHLQEEYRNYVWAQDKDGNYINEPEDHDNHGMDASRYYVLGHILGKVIKRVSTDKSDLGIY